MDTTFLVNQKLSEAQIKTIHSLTSEQEPILFAIAGEISAKATYGTTVLLATCSHLFTYDFEKGEMSRRYAIGEIEKIFTKRMYGNGMMRLRLKDGGTDPFPVCLSCFTQSLCSLLFS